MSAVPACAAPGVYKPRRPQASPLFRLVSDHFRAFHAAYEDRFAATYGNWRPVVREVAEKFLACGVLEHGFARARCDACAAPSDAIRLFDGANLDQWVSARGNEPAAWTVQDGVMTVNNKAGDIRTKRTFTNYQLHIEWRIPVGITGSRQSRGNSGVYLAATDSGGYELQVLDSYQNTTYVNGQPVACTSSLPLS